MKIFTSSNYIYIFRSERRSFPWRRLATEHVYIVLKANFSILGVPVHQFTCFFFLISPKISRRFDILILEHP